MKWLWHESWLYYLNVIYEQRIVLLKSCLAQESCNLTHFFFVQNNSYIIEWSIFCCQKKNRTVKGKLFLIRTGNPESVNWRLKTLVCLRYLNHSAWSSVFQVRLRQDLVGNTLHFLYWNKNRKKVGFRILMLHLVIARMARGHSEDAIKEPGGGAHFPCHVIDSKEVDNDYLSF